MRLIDYFDRGADLYPERHCLHDGTRGWTYRECARRPIASPTACWRPASARLEGRRLQSQPCRGLRLPARHRARRASPGRRSMRAMRSRTISTSSPTPTSHSCSIIRASRPPWRAFARPVPRSASSSASTCRRSRTGWRARRRRRPTCPTIPTGGLLASSGGTTGRPKGVQITNRNIETMNSIFWSCMPVESPPVHLMVAPMTHAAGVCSFPLLPTAAPTSSWHGRSRRHPGRDRDAQGHAHLPAADPDLHAARPSRRAQARLLLAPAPRLCRGADVGRQARRGDRECSGRC